LAEKEACGVLYLCATPIGNLEDVTLRALRVLREVDLIAAEDTRRSRKLLSHYQIHTPLTSYHRHSSDRRAKYLLDLVASGKKVALVSDAGLPGISDPGAELVASAVERGVAVVPIPGPSAGITALVVSGLPAGTFFFAGFMPAVKKARREMLQELCRRRETLIFYESPHRLPEALADVGAVLGNRRAALARELTKKHEEIIRGSIEELRVYFEKEPPRGEFTLVVAGISREEAGQEKEATRVALDPVDHVFLLEMKGMGRKEAIREVARLRGVPKREVYRAMIKLKEERNAPG
jgi:16S rRNA (cytidine1402-2'-O)-methyltransferase